MANNRRGSIWAGCVIFGVALGFILAQFMDYGRGMPIGTLIGVGVAFLWTSTLKQ
jgi:hypothetical protein